MLYKFRWISLFCCWLILAFLSAAFAVDETIEISLKLTGKLKVKRRTSDNYMMTVENWRIDSDYTQSSEYTLVRDPSGRIGGVPTEFYGVMEARNMLFEPTLSPRDKVTFRLSGQIDVNTCQDFSDPLSSSARLLTFRSHRN
ncbi:hypothetical protein L0222_05590 [bacterium]|nr:hypothetical protein [bacterium]